MERITFRNLTAADLPLMHRWLNTPHVSRWYLVDGKRNPSPEEVARHWLPYIDGTKPVKTYLFLFEGQPLGYIQSYRVADGQVYGEILELDKNAVGIDIFIGEVDRVYRGYGPAVIRKFLSEYIFSDSRVCICVIDPSTENRAAIRAYEKAGFQFLKMVYYPPENSYQYLMLIRRDEIAP